MARKKSEEVNESADLSKELGCQLLSTVEPVKYYIDTGNLSVNYVCSGKFIGGGIPGGKICQMYGSSSSGKTLWGTNILRGAQALNEVAVYLDCENALNREFAMSASRVNPEGIHRCSPPTLERSFLKIHNVMRVVKDKYKGKRNAVFVYDSIAVSPCEREFSETGLTEGYTQAEWKKKVGAKEQPGERAKVCSKELRKLEPCLEDNGSTLFIINQTRQKIGVLYGDPTTKAGGGNALDFYCSCILRAFTQKKIINDLGVIIGINLRVVNTKNRCFVPYREAHGIQLYFEKGINPISGLLEIFIQTGRITDGEKQGTYRVANAYSEGKEVVFKATKEKNLVPQDVLELCPLLIDAKSEQEVRDYFSIFSAAINEGNSESNIEKLVSEEEDGGD